MTSGEEALKQLADYLSDSQFQAEEMPGQSAFNASEESELCPLTYYFQIKPDLEQFLFYIVPEITLLPDTRNAVCEYICRANYGLRIGNFELDLSSGRLSFKSSVNFQGLELSATLIDNVIQPAREAFEELFSGAARVIAGLDSPRKR